MPTLQQRVVQVLKLATTVLIIGASAVYNTWLFTEPLLSVVVQG